MFKGGFLKRIVSTVLCLVMMCALLPCGGLAADVVVSGSCGTNVNYTLYADGELVIGGTGAMSDYKYDTIPWYDYKDEITYAYIEDGVTSIGASAFSECSALEGISIPDSVTSIGNYAFTSCRNLPQIYIPSSVSFIGGWAFHNCGFANIIIPNSVTWIGNYAFYGCTNLTNITLPDSVTKINEWVFSVCHNLTSITITKSVRTIDNYAFYDCIALTDVYYIGADEDWNKITINSNNEPLKNATIHYKSGVCGDNLTWNINEYNELTISGSGEMYDYEYGKTPWYDYKDEITYAYIEDGVTSIGAYAFSNLSVMEGISIADSVTSIGKYAFNWCTSLTEIYIPTTVTDIGEWAFNCCEKLTSVEIPDGITTINSGVFASCYELISSTIPKSVTTISDNAFYNCSALTNIYYSGSKNTWKEITIGNSNDALNDAVIYYDEVDTITGICGDKLTYTYYPDSGELIIEGTGYMYDYDGNNRPPWYDYINDITGVTINEGVKSIGNYAFDGCKYMGYVNLPEGLETIGKEAFVNCKALTEFVMPDSVTEIGDFAFQNCRGLEYITLSQSLTIIPKYAFFQCDKLLEIEIPNTVTSIGDSAFTYCHSLTEFIMPNSVTSIGVGTFDACGSLEKIQLSENLTELPERSISCCGSLKSIYIPYGIKRIGNHAFYSDVNLETIVIPETLTNIDFGAFNCTWGLTDVYYVGTLSQYNSIVIDNTDGYAKYLNLATKHCLIGYNVIYNYTYNGGISGTKILSKVPRGYNAYLNHTAVKPGWEFVGWCTASNGKTAMTTCPVVINTSLFAIFKKDAKITLYSGENELQDEYYETIYNKGSSVTLPTPSSYSGWTVKGWREDTVPQTEAYSTSATIKDDTSLYAVYSRNLTLSYNANGGNSTPSTQTATQYRNASGNVQSITFTLPGEITRDGYTFNGWRMGSKTGTLYGANSTVTIKDNTTMYADWIRDAVPCTVTYKARINGINKTYQAEYNEGETLILPDCPFDEITEGTAFVNYTVNNTQTKYTGDSITISGDTVIRVNFTPQLITQYAKDTKKAFASYSGYNAFTAKRRGFKYKKIDDTIYKSVSVSVNGDFTSVLSGLVAGYEYECYAFDVLNVNGKEVTVNGTKTRFSVHNEAVLTLSDSNIYLTVNDGYVLVASISTGEDIIWKSDNKNVATVKNGYITAVGKGSTVITASTRDGGSSATCEIKVGTRRFVPEYNFSEWNLAMRMSSNGNDETKTGAQVEQRGANVLLGIAALSGWKGVTFEENDLYPTNAGVTAYNENAEVSYHVQNAYILPMRTSPDDLTYVNNIKRALVNYGAVYAAYNEYTDSWNDDDTAYYNYEYADNLSGAHAISIVGWDDNYSKTNFNNSPAGNGAFMCKNSRGTDVNDEGFFYISYYDKNLCITDETMVFKGVGSAQNYDNIYQHDAYGPTAVVKASGEITAANVFTGRFDDEAIEAVSFYTHDMGTNYEIYVIPDYSSVSDFDGGHSAVATGSFDYAGYHTVKLDESIEVLGDKFAVVVKLIKKNSNVSTYIEMPINSGNSYINSIYGIATASSGESYLYKDNSWKDLTEVCPNANNCIKVFTSGNAAKLSLFSEEEKITSDVVLTIDEAIDAGVVFNSKFLKSLENSDAQLYSDSTGLVQSPVPFGSYDSKLYVNDIYPEKFNLKDMGYVTPVRDQGMYNTCWSHAIYASLESCMLRLVARTGSEMLNNGVGSADAETAVVDSIYTDVSGVTLDKTSYITAVGNTVKLNEQVSPTSAINKNVSWSSSNPTVATVDLYGNITALSTGNVIITVTTQEGRKQAFCEITVTEPVDADSICFSQSNAVNYVVGEEALLEYEIYPTNSNMQNVIWTSCDDNIVTIDENGLLKAVGAGTVDIILETEDGMCSMMQTITVEDGFEVHTQTTISDPIGSMCIITVSPDNIIENMQIVVAGYDSAGKLIECGKVNNSNQTIFSKMSEIEYIKTFVWDLDMKPLSPGEETVNKNFKN